MERAHVLAAAGVSAREAEVLAALAEHLSNAEIAVRLYISVRTVESHVSALLRKLGVDDRRALADVASSLAGPEAEPAGPVPGSALPVPLTSFVGRSAEGAALAAAVAEHRLVTAMGAGGVGKTRLAVAVAAAVSAELADGCWFVDLVPVTDPAMVAAAVATALGVGERPGRTVEEAVIGHLTGRAALLVLDNCEHLLDGVALFVERLLSACPRVRILTTSRARLMLPFERVFAVPGLSLPEEDDLGDAVALFVERATATGRFEPTAEDLRRIGEVCRSLDGVALAIELAAARLSTLGLDGVEQGLAEQLQLLAGGRRLDDRHRSLRSAIGWSYALLTPVDQALWRRVAVFAGPFTADAAAAVAGLPPVAPSTVADGLARLADHSLLVASTGAETRYRALETIRQYGEEQLAEADEWRDLRARHLLWCLDTAAVLAQEGDADARSPAFDRVADDLRAAVRWSGAEPDLRADAYRLATALAALTFDRGLPAEAQRRHEQAAGLTDDATAIAAALRDAAGAASSRHVGNDALRLWRAAADVSIAAGDRVGAARDLAAAAMLINRGPGIIAELPPPEMVAALIDEARALADGAPEAEGAILTAEAFQRDELDPVALDLAERAVELARRVGDPLVESAALDELTAIHLARGEVPAAVASVVRRIEVLARVRPDPTAGLELSDAYVMASEVCLTAGDIAASRAFADQLAALPFYREEGHLATARQLKVDALAGDFAAVLRRSERFRRGWEQAGRPVVGNLGGAAYAVATVHGLRGDEAARALWFAIASALRPGAEDHDGCETGYAPTFDAIVYLHRHQPVPALDRLTADPEEFCQWYTGQWRPWYAALWAEAAVLAGDARAADRIARARPIVTPNPIAAAIVERAAALAVGDTAALPRIAAALEQAGCPYQWARTLVLAGAEHRAVGQDALAAMGVAPMAVNPLPGPAGSR